MAGKLILACLAALLCFPAQSPCEEDASFDGPRVFVVTLSGVRNSDSIEDPTHQYIPNLWNRMLPEGVLYTELVSLEQEFHMPPVDAIDTGVHYPFFSRVMRPTIFQYARKQYGLPATKLWLIKHFQGDGGYYKTEGFGEETFPSSITAGLDLPPELERVLSQGEYEFVSEFKSAKAKFSGFLFDTWDSIEEPVYELVRKVVREFHPVLVHYVLAAVETAHFDSYGRYVFALKNSDQKIYELWQIIQSDPFYKDKTYLFVCPDHSRNLYYRYHEANAYDNPSRVWLYVFGPGVKKGAVIGRPVYHVDVFATIAKILKLETHPTDGKALDDAFMH